MPKFADSQICRWPLLAAACVAIGLVATAPRTARAAAPPDAATPNSLTAAEIAEGWLLLFDGATLFGWQPGSDANWKVRDGAITASEGKQGLLATTSEFADYVLHVDFRHEAKTNSGVFLRTVLQPTDPAADCYELNIADGPVSPFATGSFVNRQKAPSVPFSDQWHHYEVAAQGDHFRVLLDGAEVLDYRDPHPLARGRIGLQFREGPVEFRNIKLRPLGLQPIFNGQDLAGWHVLPDHKSVFSVADGTLNVKNGNGALESDPRYADFILQLQIRTNGKGLNSGIFFRSIPGEFWNGYECQIQNAYKDNDRTKPADCGTGGFYRRQDAQDRGRRFHLVRRNVDRHWQSHGRLGQRLPG